MQREGDEVHVETDDARGGESTGVMRWVLGISLLAAIILLSGIWMFGAWTQDDAESEITAAGKVMAEDDDANADTGTDSIVGTNPDAMDAIDAEELPPGTLED